MNDDSKKLVSISKGNFITVVGLDVECYVLRDQENTPVFSQRGMAKILGLAEDDGTALPRFIRSRLMRQHGGAIIQEKIDNPLTFQWLGAGGAGVKRGPGTKINAFDAPYLIDIAQLVIEIYHKGKWPDELGGVLESCFRIISASAKAGITQLVYDLCGFDTNKNERIRAYQLYVIEEAQSYEKEYPPEIYDEWYRLYELEKPHRGRPWKFRHLTVEHVYLPLAKSNGKVLELVRIQKLTGGDRNKKLYQFLSTIGVRALRLHLGRLLEIAETSKTQEEYEERVDERFGGGQQKIPFYSKNEYDSEE